MKTNSLHLLISIFALIAFSSVQMLAQSAEKSSVKIVGAMKNVMWKGELFGTIDLDTIANKKHLYGFGPVEYLKGEILIVDGTCYKSTVINDSTMQVTETFKLKAPFFAYDQINQWVETKIPDSVLNPSQLEEFLNQTTQNFPRPFLFKITAMVDSSTIHIVNLPDSTIVSSPDDAHHGKKEFIIKNKKSVLIGFFSTEHKTIFTHHDTFIHMHLITDDKQQMGHVDDLNLKMGTVKLYLPKI